VRFSVWNPGTAQFDYFETPELAQSSNAEKPSHLTSRTLGSTVEQAAWPLPAAAVPAGSGPHAEGRVAVHRGAAALAGDDDGLSLVKMGLLLAAGALGVKYLLPRRRR
jgi:hypothetical protein